MKPVRLGMIGLGFIPTSAHLPGLAPLIENGTVVLQAFCDSNEETLQEQAAAYKPRAVYDNHHELFEREQLDAIYLCIPPTLHTDEILIAADKGIAVFVEKPQSMDLAQAMLFNDAVQKAGIVTQVGFVHRYEPAVEPLRQLLAQRRPRHALLQALYSGKPLRYWTSRYELCGGSFVENTIHRVDLLRYFLGDIAAVSAFYVDSTPEERIEPMNLPHVYNVNYRLASGLTANACTSRVLTNAGSSRREFMVVSDDSLIEWYPDRIVENDDVVWKTEIEESPFATQARAFIAAVQAGDPGMPLSPCADGINTLAAVLGANASAERGGELIHLDQMVEADS